MAQTQAQARASDAVAAWLASHHRNPAWLVEAARADPGTIGDFLNGQRWPKLGTQGRIEEALGWPAGTIRQIGNGGPVPDGLTASDAAPARAAEDPVRRAILDDPRLGRREKRVLLQALAAMLEEDGRVDDIDRDDRAG